LPVSKEMSVPPRLRVSETVSMRFLLACRKERGRGQLSVVGLGAMPGARN
jgi:hypothetical protein